MSFSYERDDEQRVHAEGSINLICAPFQTHQAGLPEWLKNSADEYARRDTPEGNRIIVLIMQNPRSGRPSSISVLDFGGMSADAIDNNFSVWADPDSATRTASDRSLIQGGHGNGGKCYMSQMFEDHAVVETVEQGRGCRYGVQGGSREFGYSPTRSRGRDFPVPDVRAHLEATLNQYGQRTENLPEGSLDALDRSGGFTMVTGVAPKQMGGRRMPVVRTRDELMEHPQMQRTLQMCKVYILNGDTLDGPITPAEIEPMPGAEAPRVIAIPETLADPETGDEVSTTEFGVQPGGELILRTSAVRLQRRRRNNITYHAQSGFIGYEPVDRLGVTTSYRNHIYGDCHLMALEHAKLNQREDLAETPVTRAVRKFVADEIEKYGREFEARDRHTRSQEEQNELSRLNDLLDRWKNGFIDDVLGGGGEAGTGDTDPPPGLPSGTPARIVVLPGHKSAGVGVSIKPKLKFYDVSGDQIRPVPYKLTSTDLSVVGVDHGLNVLETKAPGTSSIGATTMDGSVVSDLVTLSVVDIASISMDAEVEVPMGSRRKIGIKATLKSGEVRDDVALIVETSDASTAQVSTAGTVFGVEQGEAVLTARDANATSDPSTSVKVGPADEGGDDDGEGRNYPRILVSGIDPDPATGETFEMAPDEPRVHQRPVDIARHIWWINTSSPIARILLDDHGVETPQWRLYHVECFIEALMWIVMEQLGAMDDSYVGQDWVQLQGDENADIRSQIADALREFIREGVDPDEGEAE